MYMLILPFDLIFWATILLIHCIKYEDIHFLSFLLDRPGVLAVAY